MLFIAFSQHLKLFLKITDERAYAHILALAMFISNDSWHLTWNIIYDPELKEEKANKKIILVKVEDM